MGFLNGGDVELRVSRRAIVLAAVAIASAAAFAIGLRSALEPAAKSGVAPMAEALPPTPPAAMPSAAAPAGMSPAAAGAPAALPGLDVMAARLEAKVRTGSGTADQWLLLGQTYRELGRDAEAAAAFERSVALDPANASARTELDAARARTAGRAAPR